MFTFAIVGITFVLLHDFINLNYSLFDIPKLCRYKISMLNSFQKNIEFNYEVGINAKLLFLDMLLMRNHNDITATVYRKESNSDVYLDGNSFTPSSWKRGRLKTLVEIAYVICSTQSLLEKKN